MLKSILNVATELTKTEQSLISGSGGGRFEICNTIGEPVICKTGHCNQNRDGSWGCLLFN